MLVHFFFGLKVMWGRLRSTASINDSRADALARIAEPDRVAGHGNRTRTSFEDHCSDTSTNSVTPAHHSSMLRIRSVAVSAVYFHRFSIARHRLADRLQRPTSMIPFAVHSYVWVRSIPLNEHHVGRTRQQSRCTLLCHLGLGIH